MSRQLTLEKLKELWPQRAEIFNKKEAQDIVNRFDFVDKLIDEILSPKNKVTIYNEQVWIGDKEVRIKNDKSQSSPSLNYFGPAEDDILPKDDPKKGISILAEKIPDFKDLIWKTATLLGGYDENTGREMRAEYRIVSTTGKGKENGSLNSERINKWRSSHLATNNYFFRVMEAIQNIHSGNFDIEDHNIVLLHSTQEKNEETQKDWLKTRFPLKFFFMWAKKDKVLHPVSLMAYRNLTNQDDENLQFEHVNSEYSDFISKWENYSKKFFHKVLGDENPEPDKISELSKLISIMTLSKPDTKNIYELLETGNKAVILYGPPGTGKTFKAEQVAKELLTKNEELSDEELEKCRFSYWEKPDYSNGYYELIQFHPNYTYEDFIGGIQPKLNENEGTVSYELKEGIFKQVCDWAKENSDLKFIVIIDEINRADLSAIFGELMYALEKRGNPLNIPHFEKEFTIPKNVYVIGTMNNLDKSLVTFDLALRRRFGFFKMEPEMSSLANQELLGGKIEENQLNKFIERCEDINSQICKELKLSEEYKIGHAYFGKIKDFLPDLTEKEEPDAKITTWELEKLWNYHLKPLLEEYLGSEVDEAGIKEKLEILETEFTKSLED